MEREQLDRLIRTPHAVEQQDMAALRELSERAPWFAGAQLLRTVGERTSGDVRSDSGLQRAAAHIPSRAVLYDLVERPQQHTEERRAAVMKVVTEHSEQNTPTAAITEAPAQPAPVAMTVNEDVISAAPSAPPAEVEVPEQPVEVPVATAVPMAEQERPVAVVEPEEGPTSAAEAAQAEEDPLERQILESAMASIYDLTLHAPPPRDLKPLASAAGTEAVPEASPAPVKQNLSTVTEAPAAKAVPPVEAPRPAARAANGRLRFTSWLSTEEPAGQEAFQPLPPPTPSAVGPDTAVAEPVSAAPPPAPPAAPSGKPAAPVDVGSLIDRFIQQETPAPTKKATFFTPQQAAKKSLDDSAGLVTETLARIYEKQGNLQKAIDAYRKLALKYPEKSAYFAALSRSLEEQLNT
jgi:hypothetical protein